MTEGHGGKRPRTSPDISPDLRRRIERVRQQQARAEAAQSAVTVEMRALVRELQATGLTVRQIGALMGLSGMRISAISRSKPG